MKMEYKTKNSQRVYVNRGDQDSYSKDASAKLTVKNLEKRVKRESKRIDQYKIDAFAKS